MDNSNEILHNYLSDYWEYVLKVSPTFATYIGDHRYNDLLEDLSEESAKAQVDYFSELLLNLDKIDESRLSTDNRLNNELLKNTLNNHIGFYRYKTHYLPVNHLSGPHIDFPQIIEYHPFKTEKDYADYISRLNAFPSQIEQLIEVLQNGVAHNMTSFGNSIEHVLNQVDAFTKFSSDVHPLITPLNNMPDNISENDKKRIIDTVNKSISSHVTPAYNKLHHYLSSDYSRHYRKHEGIWSLPDGVELYRFYVRYHTTTDLTPEEIHDIGLSEINRIQLDIKEVMKQTGFSGDIRAFAGHVKKRKELSPGSSREILDGYREILSGMDKKLPDFFDNLPMAKYDIKQIEKYREQAAPAAYYYPPPSDFSRPGYFYINTFKPEDRPVYGMEALAYHEAVPGHHLQIALMQELKNIPEFRRYEGSTAFIEGWALYAELLAKEMGFYQNIYSEYGRLTNEVWRAARLVVDTGIHFFKWNRDKAIQYCIDNTGLEAHEIEVEIDRYIAMPAQALAYKIGELKIRQLREKAARKTGTDFDIKQFHNMVLQNGALPLYLLEKIINKSINSA
jgi:uncharacterized protein (DUF885 family)